VQDDHGLAVGPSAFFVIEFVFAAGGEPSGVEGIVVGI
jgi:hypothetical protein